METDVRQKLDLWIEHGLLTSDQRDAITAFEQMHRRDEPPSEAGQGRLASAVSTVGAAVAIGAVAGIMAIFASDWSSTQAAIAASIGAIVVFAAAWMLVRNGWGAPAGLFAFCGLALIPLAFGFIAHALGWWPEGDASTAIRRQEQVVGAALLLAILPGMLTTRLGLRQAWAALPAAVWIGTTLLFTSTFENVGVVLAQVALGVAVAGVAGFVWGRNETGRGAAWWMQLGALILAAQGIVISAFEERAIFALLGVLAAATIFTVGAVRNRTVWIVAGALPAVIPAGRLIFEYFEGIGGLLLVALMGMGIAFLPLLLLRRRDSRALTG